MLQAFAKSFIIGIRNCQELNSSIFKGRDSFDNIWSRKRDVLNTSSTVVIDILLDLRFPLSISRLINWHFHSLVKISDDNWSERRVLCVNNAIINWPESVEIKHLLIPLSNSLHLEIWLISNAMIYLKKLNRWHYSVKFFLQVMSFESWQEESFVINSLDESVNCIAICSNGSNNDWAILILQCFRSFDTFGSPRHCFIMDPLSIIYKKCDVLNSVSMLCELLWELSVARI